MFRDSVIVLRKELTDAFRDRKGLISALFYPLLGPLLLMALFFVLGQTRASQTTQRIELPVVGAENAPALVDFLKQRDVTIAPPPADLRAAVQRGDLPVALEIGPDFTRAFAAGQPAPIQFIVDRSRQSGSVVSDRVRDLLDEFNAATTRARLQAAGIDPAVVEPLKIADVDVATAQSRASAFLNLAPYFIIFALFLGGAGIAIDTTVGERERRSLEPLLLTGVPRRQIVFGKMLAALVMTLITVLETIIAFGLVLNLVPLSEFIGLPVSLPPMAMVLTFLITAPIMLLAVALQMIIATVSGSFKEAQSYLMFLPLIPALPGMFLAFLPIKPELWTMLIPTFGQQVLINQVIRGETVSALHVIVSTAVTLGLGAVLLLLVLRLYQREQVLFTKAG